MDTLPRSLLPLGLKDLGDGTIKLQASIFGSPR